MPGYLTELMEVSESEETHPEEFEGEGNEPDNESRFAPEYRARVLAPDFPCLPCQAQAAINTTEGASNHA